MKLLIGLGNPDPKYKLNRHNAGHLLVDAIASLQHDNVKILKTNTFMNDSGKFVKKALTANPYPLTALYIAHDDLDIRLGQYKIQFGVGPKVHYGIQSIENELGTKDFWRIRIGIDNREQGTGDREQGEKYVLEDFSSEELKILEEVYAKIRDDIAKI